MSEDRETVGLRIFSEGIELNLGVGEKVDVIGGSVLWNQYTECPKCGKKDESIPIDDYDIDYDFYCSYCGYHYYKEKQENSN